MLYFIDTEFLTNPPNLISLGVVCEDGREFYMENALAPIHLANAFVRREVLPGLVGPASSGFLPYAIADSLQRFVRDKPVFVGWYCACDYWMLQSLFGDFENWPAKWPKHIIDLKQILWLAGDPPIDEGHSGKHNALEDARWAARLFYAMQAGQLTLFDNSTVRFNKEFLGCLQKSG